MLRIHTNANAAVSSDLIGKRGEDVSTRPAPKHVDRDDAHQTHHFICDEFVIQLTPWYVMKFSDNINES